MASILDLINSLTGQNTPVIPDSLRLLATQAPTDNRLTTAGSFPTAPSASNTTPLEPSGIDLAALLTGLSQPSVTQVAPAPASVDINAILPSSTPIKDTVTTPVDVSNVVPIQQGKTILKSEPVTSDNVGKRKILSAEEFNKSFANDPAYKDKGLVATQDANGQITFSNIPSSSTIQPNIQGATGVSASNFTTLLKNITNPVDSQGNPIKVSPDEQARQLYTLQAQGLATIANLKQSSVQQANSEFNVTDLQTRLAASEARDKADPNYKFFLTDSTATKALRNELITAQNGANARAGEILSTNPEAAQLTSYLQSAAKDQERLANATIQRTSINQIKEDDAIANLSTGEKALQVAIDPSFATKPIGDIANKVASQKTNVAFRNAAAAVDIGNPDNLVGLVAQKNPYAIPAIIAAYASNLTDPTKIGEAQIAAKNDATYINNIVSNDKFFQDEVQRLYGVDDPNGTLKKYKQDIVTASNKDKTGLAIRAQLASGLLMQKSMSQFVNNMGAGTWGDTFATVLADPVLGPAFAQVQQENAVNKQPPSLGALIAKVQGNPEALIKLKTITGQAYQAANQGPFQKVDTTTVDAMFNRQVTNGIMSKLANAFQPSNTGGFGFGSSFN